MRFLRFPTLTLIILALAGPALSPALAAETWKIDPVHTSILFRVEHLGVSRVWGRFNTVSGQAVIDEQNPSASSIEIEIPIDSIDTNDAKRDKHLKSPDFFDAGTFPRARFVSRSVEKKGDTYVVSGTLELHGVKKPITLSLERVGSGKDPWGGFRTGFSGKTTIRRSEFNIKYGLGGLLGDDVELFIDVELIRSR